jgi:hypothetical protein
MPMLPMNPPDTVNIICFLMFSVLLELLLIIIEKAQDREQEKKTGM